MKHACAICYRSAIAGLEFLLVRTSGSRLWTFPKGKIEENESSWAAAAREAREEAGVRGIVAPDLLRIFTYKKENARKPLQIVAHLLNVNEVLPDGEPGRNPTWFGRRQAKQALSEGRAPEYASELTALVDAACHRLGTIPGND